MSILRPDTISIIRRVQTGKSNSGEPTFTITTLQDGVPALLDPMPAGSRMGGDLQVEIEGVVYLQTHEGFIDGLMPAAFAGLGLNPGDAFDFTDGLTYIIAENGQAAFIDIAANDKIVDQNLDTVGKPNAFLVLAVASYYNVKPVREVRLAFGRAW